MNQFRIALMMLFLAFAGVAMADGAPGAAVENGEVAVEEAAIKNGDSTKKVLYIAIAATMAFGCMSAAYAVAKIGSAVMGAAAEKPEIIGKAIAFVGLGEGIALFAFLIALFMYTKM